MVGLLGQKANGEVIYRAVNKLEDAIIQSFISPILVDLTTIEDNVSISSTEMMLTDDKRWLGYMHYSLPIGYEVGTIGNITLDKFKKIKLKKNGTR